MITVNRFKRIINECPDNWTIVFRKWEHMSPTNDGPYQGYKGFPNIVGIKIIDISDRIDDIEGNKIRTIIVEDDIDEDLTGNPQEILEKIIDELNDNDVIDFNIQVEETPGHLDLIKLNVEAGDKGYSDKIMIIDVDEMSSNTQTGYAQLLLKTILGK